MGLPFLSADTTRPKHSSALTGESIRKFASPRVTRCWPCRPGTRWVQNLPARKQTMISPELISSARPASTVSRSPIHRVGSILLPPTMVRTFPDVLRTSRKNSFLVCSIKSAPIARIITSQWDRSFSKSKLINRHCTSRSSPSQGKRRVTRLPFTHKASVVVPFNGTSTKASRELE